MFYLLILKWFKYLYSETQLSYPQQQDFFFRFFMDMLRFFVAFTKFENHDISSIVFHISSADLLTINSSIDNTTPP